MTKTPGLIIPSAYKSEEELKTDLKRRGQEAGFTEFDPSAFVEHSDDVNDFLEHYGIKGMKWGVRRSQRELNSLAGRSNRPAGVSRGVNREARKDAQEFARAKAFYGTGAGTRRKLIRQTVEGKTKRIEGYKKAFDFHSERQDTSKHASKAVSERKRKDRKEKTRQTVGAVARSATGQMGTQAAFVSAAFAGAAFLQSERGQTVMRNVGSKVNSTADQYRRSRGAAYISDYIKRNS